ncbi:MAG: AAA family ATPase [Acidobacteriota bacterium]
MIGIEPTSNAFHRIRSIRVKGGFLDGLDVEFKDGLNCLIGGRGAGKTTVLEVLRWTLDHMPDQTDSSAHYRRVDKLITANLQGGQVELEVETRDDIRYRVRKDADGTSLVMNSAGDPVGIEIGRGTIFSADFYSQNQVEEIANDPLFQLKLIDKFVEEKISEITRQIQRLESELRENAEKILKLRGDITGLREKLSALPEVSEKLKAHKIEAGDEEGKVLRQASQGKALRDQETRALNRLDEILSDETERLSRGLTDLPASISELIHERILSGPNGTRLQRIKDILTDSAKELILKVQEASRLLEGMREELQKESDNLSALHIKQEKAYQDLLDEREKEKDKLKERDQLLRREAELEEEQKRLEERQAVLQQTELARATLLHRLSDLKDDRFEERLTVAQSLSEQLSPAIRVQIEQYGNTDSYRSLLLEAMKGSGFKYTQVVDRVVQRIPPHEFASIVQRGDSQTLSDHLEIDTDRANRLILQIKDTTTVFEVETVDLHDRPTIELKDGPDYKDSTVLSTGQKCTTILPILLLESASPLLIDQPEDNLDNAFIYETIVKSIRGVSGRRQLIFVTHNPNVPVLGDAQRVVVLQSTGRRASVKAAGTVDEVKDEIETILEGGREAFQKRKERYGY